MSQFTAGPWKPYKRDRGGWNIHGNINGGSYMAVIALVRGTSHATTLEKMDNEEEANARLIAAAPELLEALRDAIPYLIRLGDFIGNGEADDPMGRCRVIGAIKDAIAKTEGRGSHDRHTNHL